MSQRDDGFYIGQMLEYAKAIERRVAQSSREEFDRNEDVQSRLITLLQYMGEAARHVSRSITDAHPEIEWKEIIGMRHRLVHGYDRINLDKVWSTATIDIPSLVANLKNLHCNGRHTSL
jgi:uncharacterized protein with HEPN domain